MRPVAGSCLEMHAMLSSHPSRLRGAQRGERPRPSAKGTLREAPTPKGPGSLAGGRDLAAGRVVAVRHLRVYEVRGPQPARSARFPVVLQNAPDGPPGARRCSPAKRSAVHCRKMPDSSVGPGPSARDADAAAAAVATRASYFARYLELLEVEGAGRIRPVGR